VTGLREVWILSSHDLRKRWRSVLIWALALGGVGALYVALYPTMKNFMDEFVKQAPESLRSWMGVAGTTMSVEQWVGMKFLNLFVPVSLPFLVMLIGARTVAGNEERRALDLQLSNPLRRWQVIVAPVVTMTVSLVGVLAVIWVLSYVTALIAGVDLSPSLLAAGLAVLLPFCLLFGTFSLLLSTVVRRSFLATTIPAVVLVVMYLLESLAQSIKSVEPARVFSLFYHLGSAIGGDVHVTATLLMSAGVCILTGSAIAAFAKRDIYT
jgi:ABC-2 type transport system permease protein